MEEIRETLAEIIARYPQLSEDFREILEEYDAARAIAAMDDAIEELDQSDVIVIARLLQACEELSYRKPGRLLTPEKIIEITGHVPFDSIYSAPPDEVDFSLNNVMKLLQAQLDKGGE